MRNILLNLGLKINRTDIFSEYKKLKKLSSLSQKELQKYQERKLKEILLHSWNNVPYYRRILEKNNVVKDGKVNLKNFNKIPILTKEIIRHNFEDLKSKDKNYNKRKPYLNTSGGSTGEPVKFIQDNKTWNEGMAGKWLFYTFISKNFPVKLMKLWGSERDILKGGYGAVGNFKSWIYQRKFLNSFKMSKGDMRNYVNEINSYKPVIIEAYVQSIYELSKFIKENDFKIYSPKGVLTSAGTLYPEMKKLIEEVFGCNVFNRYGSREVGDMACSCENDEGLHLNIFSHYFEILNNKMNPCKPGEFGKVYVTTLDNYSMPLIRYDIGDIAVPSEKKECSCGRGLPLIESVRGRETEFFKKKNGDLINPGIFRQLLYFKKGIAKYQIIQKNYDLIIFKIIIEGKKNKEQFSIDKKKIENSIKKVMGTDCKIKWEFVKEIKPTKSGKYLYTICEVK
jgi:phenylacetate-CoA ligase